MNRFHTIIAVAVAFSACSARVPPLVVSDLEVTAPLPGSAMSAGYFSVTNHSDEDISVSHVQSAEFGSVEMHETVIVDGIARMRKLDAVSVAPGETVVFERGGKHLMLMRPVADPEQVTLAFYSGDALLLTVDTRIKQGD